MRVTKTIKEAIHAHAKSAYPNECCGLIIDGQYYPCDNVAVNPTEHFEIDPKDFARAESMGQIQAIVHSHPDGNAKPSEIDRVQMSIHGLDWVICAFGYHADGKEYFDVKCHKPKAYQAPLLGREYHHGVQDCYSLVRDYYHRE
ncbi:C40 family peptidase, partial [Moraxella catarrhalis]|uniref:C40 family peptidase n=1 Tax=Moraxella catarrhalis TaxID=480 RepID=UPI001883DF10